MSKQPGSSEKDADWLEGWQHTEVAAEPAPQYEAESFGGVLSMFATGMSFLYGVLAVAVAAVIVVLVFEEIRSWKGPVDPLRIGKTLGLGTLGLGGTYGLFLYMKSHLYVLPPPTREEEEEEEDEPAEDDSMFSKVDE